MLYIKVTEVAKRLRKHYGEPEKRDRDEPVLSLIKVILSQNTNDKNRDRAYNSIIQKYGCKEEILNANREELAELISVAGMHNIKSKRILKCLRKIKEERGNLDLSFLKEMELDEAKRWLKQLPGVGPKSAAIILNFNFDMAAFPVDTHVFRVSKRLGLISDNINRDKAHDILEEKVKDKDPYSFHINLIKHGRKICKSRKPRCEECFLTQICNYYKEEVR